jgi:hypothetical protein
MGGYPTSRHYHLVCGHRRRERPHAARRLVCDSARDSSWRLAHRSPLASLPRVAPVLSRLGARKPQDLSPCRSSSRRRSPASLLGSFVHAVSGGSALPQNVLPARQPRQARLFKKRMPHQRAPAPARRPWPAAISTSDGVATQATARSITDGVPAGLFPECLHARASSACRAPATPAAVLQPHRPRRARVTCDGMLKEDGPRPAGDRTARPGHQST